MFSQEMNQTSENHPFSRRGGLESRLFCAVISKGWARDPPFPRREGAVEDGASSLRDGRGVGREERRGTIGRSRGLHGGANNKMTQTLNHIDSKAKTLLANYLPTKLIVRT